MTNSITDILTADKSDLIVLLNVKDPQEEIEEVSEEAEEDSEEEAEEASEEDSIIEMLETQLLT
jgi:hypothetical protein